MSGPGPLPRAVRIVLKAGTLLVPRRHRERWMREWDSELRAERAHRHESVEGPRAPLWWIALGSWVDARAMARLDRAGRSQGASGAMASATRQALRSLLHRPGLSATAVITLGLGLGGTAAILTLFDQVVLAPLDYPESERLVALQNDVPCVGEDTRWHLATAQLVYYRAESRTLDRVAATWQSGANLQTGDGPLRVRTAAVSADAMEILGAEAVHGRVLTAEDDRPAAADVAVLAHGFWQRAFGADPGVVGRTLPLDDRQVEIVGVMAPGIELPWAGPGSGTDLWTALGIDPSGPFQNSHVLPAIGRLGAGVDLVTAQAELDALGSRLPDRFPEVYGRSFIDECGFRARALPLGEEVVGDLGEALWLLLGAGGLVLLVAAANVANLTLVRLERRRGDLAVRMALGAGVGDLRRLLWVESSLLAGGGVVLGLLLATWGMPLILGLAPDDLPGLDRGLPGPTAIAATVALGFLVALGITLTALTQLSPGALAASVRGDTRTRTAGVDRQHLRRGLVVAQMALALTLVTGAGLLVRTIGALTSVDPGFDPEGVLVADLHPTPDGRFDDVERWATWSAVLDRVAALPGVRAAGLSSHLPLSGAFGCTVQGFADTAVVDRLADRGITTCAGQAVVTPGFFEALGIPLEEGRTFVDADLDAPETGAVVVSREFADRFWPGEAALGRQVAPSGRDGPWYRVVGVVGDIPGETLGGEPANAIYYPVVRIPGSAGYFPDGLTLVVQTDGADPLGRLEAVRTSIAAADPTMSVAGAAALSTVVDRSLGRLTFTALLLRIAAFVGLALAAVGLYGVVSYVVARRTREIGTRIALGARPGGMEWMVLRGTAVLIFGGLLLGGALSLAVTRFMRGLLFGVAPTDPATLAGGALLLTLVALSAAWIPARRAARIDPLEALRDD